MKLDLEIKAFHLVHLVNEGLSLGSFCENKGLSFGSFGGKEGFSFGSFGVEKP
jgi:hypothetical protein